MNRVSKSLYFQNKNMLRNTLLFVLFYAAASIFIISLPVIFKGLRIGGTNFNSGFYMGAAIFAFVYVISVYKETFNYLLMFGNTRKTIFISSIITNTAMSIILAIISAISPHLEKPVIKLFGYNYSNINLLNLIYQDSNWASELLFYAALFILLTSFSMLYGSLSYKLGSIFIVVFWVAFGISIISFPIITEINNITFILRAIELFFSLGVPNGILLASVNFILTAVVFNALAYLLSMRQPQVE